MFQSLYLYISISLLSSPIFKFNIQKHISSQYEKKKCIKLTMWTWSLFRTEGGSEKSLLVWKHKSPNLLGFGCLLWQEHSLDVWQYTSLGNGHTAQKLVQLFIVTDGKLQMTGVDPGLLVVTGCVAGQLEDLSCQIFHDSCQVDWCTGSYHARHSYPCARNDEHDLLGTEVQPLQIGSWAWSLLFLLYHVQTYWSWCVSAFVSKLNDLYSHNNFAYIPPARILASCSGRSDTNSTIAPWSIHRPITASHSQHGSVNGQLRVCSGSQLGSLICIRHDIYSSALR